MRIEPVRAGRDDAPYECIAENGVGDAVSAEATLTVYEGTDSGRKKYATEKMYLKIYFYHCFIADKAPVGFPTIEVGV